MPEILPFRGLRFDAASTGDLSAVVAPPYDVIGPAERAALEAASPYNVVRLILGPLAEEGTPGKYRRARELLGSWHAGGALALDPAPALTIYEERSTVAGEPHVQRGILAAVALDDPSGVLPHERTYGPIVEDRLTLMRETEANLDPVFMVYDGADASAAAALDAAVARDPDAAFTTADGIAHRAWRLDDAAAIDAVAAALEKVTVVIADGHHRWRTAQTYREERRARDGAGPWDHALAFLVDASRSGPALLPIHRTLAASTAEEVLDAAGEAFDVSPSDLDPATLAASLGPRTFGVWDGRRAWTLRLRDAAAAAEAMPADRSAAWRELDVAILHSLLFERALGGVAPGFVHSAAEADEAIRRGEAASAILLPPMSFDAVRAVADAGDPMPQKSTYFVPKPKTGIVLRPLDEAAFRQA